MSNPVPKAPPEEYMVRIREYTVDTELGKVYNTSGVELGGRTNGYVHITAFDRHWKRANIVWWKHTGEWPKQILDHKDRNKLNDSITNLELSTAKLNANNNGLELTRLKMETEYSDGRTYYKQF